MFPVDNTDFTLSAKCQIFDVGKYPFLDDTKLQVVKKVKDYAISKNYKFSEIDGIKVYFSDGFALVRASNTGPNITTRFEAKTKERLEEIKKEFISIIKE